MLEDEDDKELIRDAKKRLANMTTDDELKQIPAQLVRECEIFVIFFVKFLFY
jgi:hypothetical protein